MLDKHTFYPIRSPSTETHKLPHQMTSTERKLCELDLEDATVLGFEPHRWSDHAWKSPTDGVKTRHHYTEF